MSSNGHRRGLDSGVVVARGLVSVAMGLLALGRAVGWDATWRAFGITPLQPSFFDMHVVNDYAACAWKGIDAYAPQAAMATTLIFHRLGCGSALSVSMGCTARGFQR
jgi:hypothetical protein